MKNLNFLPQPKNRIKNQELTPTSESRGPDRSVGRSKVKYLVVSLAGLGALVVGATAGSLSPSAAPGSTFYTLTQLYDSIAGTFDSSGLTASTTGSLLQGIKYISNNLFWASNSADIYYAGGNVGIGDSTPDAYLDIQPATASSGPLFIVASGSNERFRITSGGNVGIGTTAPTSKLEVLGRLEVGGTASASYFLTGNSLQVAGFSSQSYSRFGTSTTTHSNWMSTASDLFLSNDLEGRGSLSFAGPASLSNTMWVSPGGYAGNVGIGTTTPLTRFEVEGTASASNLLTVGSLQVANGGATVSYSRFGTGTTTHTGSIGLANDLLVSGDLEVNSSAAFDGFVKIASHSAIGNSANINGGTFVSSFTNLNLGAQFKAVLDLEENITSLVSPVTVYDGQLVALNLNPGGSVDASVNGIDSQIEVATGNNQTFQPIVGIRTGFTHKGGGTVNYAYGARIMDAIPPANGGVIDSNFGIQIGNQAGANINKAWGLYVLGDGLQNIFEGRVGIGYSETVNSNKGRLWIVDSAIGSLASGSFAIRSSNTIGSVASISATSLAGGSIFKLTLPASSSANNPHGLLLAQTNTGVVIASWSMGGKLALRSSILSHGADSTCTGVNTPTSGCIDYAESFPSFDNTLEPGDLVAVDAEHPQGVVKARINADSTQNNADIPQESAYQSALIGVVSTNPAALITGNSFVTGANASKRTEGQVPVALAGRVPVKFSNENGEITAGDRLTVSKTKPGYAMRATEAGMTLGIALESSTRLNLVNEVQPRADQILTFINLSYWAPTIPELTLDGNELTLSSGQMYDIDLLFKSVVKKIYETFNIFLDTGLIQTVRGVFEKEVCIGSTCIDENQLKALIQQQGIPTITLIPTPTPTLETTSSPELIPELSIEPSATPEVSVTPEIPATPTSTVEPTPISTPEATLPILPSAEPTEDQNRGSSISQPSPDVGGEIGTEPVIETSTPAVETPIE